jgi:ABC-type transport system involved in multi-copper enzyme maturation permease subunit
MLRYELLMHIKSWRLWLCLAALIAVTVPWRMLLSAETDREVLDRFAEHFWEITRGDWLLFAPVLILITVDTVGRVRLTGVQPLLFTKPFSMLSFLLACWVAVVILAGFLAGAVLTTRYVVARFSLGFLIPAAPFGWLLALGAVPWAMALIALAIWVRTIFKHNILAYLVSAILAGAMFLATDTFRLPVLGWNTALLDPLVQHYIPAIGRDLDGPEYGWAFANTVLLSLLFLTLACYYTRRREPQRKIIPGYGKRWADMPTFRRFLSNLRIDRCVGAEVHLAFAATLALAAAAGYRFATESRTLSHLRQQWATELRQDLRQAGPVTAGLRITHYAGDVEISSRVNVAGNLRMDIANTTNTAVERLALRIPFGLTAERLEDGDKNALAWRRWGDVLVADLRQPLAPGTSTTIHVVYNGRPMNLEIGEPLPFSPQYDIRTLRLEDAGISLGSKYQQIGVWLLPRTVALTRGSDGIVPVETQRLFTADLCVATFNDREPISPDGAVEPLGRKDGLSRSRLRLARPRGDFTLFIAPYEKVQRTFGPLSLRVYCFAADRSTVVFALSELEETVERWARIFCPTEGSSLTLIEAPPTYRSDSALPPGTLDSDDLERLRRYWPRFTKHESDGFSVVSSYQTALSSALAARILRESFHPERPIEPLRAALFHYLTGSVRRSEIGPLARKSGQMFTVIRSRPESVFLDPARQALFDTPLIRRMASAASFNASDAVFFWRLTHYLLQDDKFADFLRALANDYRNRPVTAADLRALAERFYGSSLDWFFDHWLYGTGMPKYEITAARAVMTENQRTRDIEYDVTVVVSNRGTGKMPVPVVLTTERDRITRTVWLDSRTSATVALHVPDRPEMAYIDPEGWITQAATGDRETRSRGPAWRRVLVVE